MSARPWILLRGLTRESRHWGAFAASLDAACAGVLPIDLPGNGTAAHTRSPARVEAFVDAVLKAGFRTRDIADASTPAASILGTGAIGEQVLKFI